MEWLLRLILQILTQNRILSLGITEFRFLNKHGDEIELTSATLPSSAVAPVSVEA